MPRERPKKWQKDKKKKKKNKGAMRQIALSLRGALTPPALSSLAVCYSLSPTTPCILPLPLPPFSPPPFFEWLHPWLMTFLGQGLNSSSRCDLRCSCGDAGAGIKPAPLPPEPPLKPLQSDPICNPLPRSENASLSCKSPLTYGLPSSGMIFITSEDG